MIRILFVCHGRRLASLRKTLKKQALPEQNLLFYDRFMTVEEQVMTLGKIRAHVLIIKNKYVGSFYVSQFDLQFTCSGEKILE